MTLSRTFLKQLFVHRSAKDLGCFRGGLKKTVSVSWDALWWTYHPAGWLHVSICFFPLLRVHSFEGNPFLRADFFGRIWFNHIIVCRYRDRRTNVVTKTQRPAMEAAAAVAANDGLENRRQKKNQAQKKQ